MSPSSVRLLSSLECPFFAGGGRSESSERARGVVRPISGHWLGSPRQRSGGNDGPLVANYGLAGHFRVSAMTDGQVSELGAAEPWVTGPSFAAGGPSFGRTLPVV